MGTKITMSAALELKFCKDCKWIVLKGKRFEFARCGHLNATSILEVDYVTGEKPDTKTNYYCTTERIFNTPRGCGPEGRNWEPK